MTWLIFVAGISVGLIARPLYRRVRDLFSPSHDAIDMHSPERVQMMIKRNNKD